MKRFFFMIIMIVSAVVLQAQVINEPKAEVQTDIQVENIWHKGEILAVSDDVNDYFASSRIWLQTDDCRTLFHWTGSELVVVDVQFQAKTGANVVDYIHDHSYSLQSDGSFTTAYEVPVVNVLTYSALNGWKNKKCYDEPFLFGEVSYGKKYTEYKDMLIGGVESLNGDNYLHFDYDVLIEKKKITLKIKKYYFLNEKIVVDVFFEKEYKVE
ncbi:MAG: hypothetical protein IKW58_02150 [Alphaproteobacteria bacterium]|nr:hypothetical protein [Alphaproteobacteria bacterium]